MFGLSANEKIIKKQAEYISKLEADNHRLKSIVDSNNQIEIDHSEYIIDFETLQPFSIERVPVGNGTYKTSIGYFLNNEPKEWILWCNITTHNRLAQEFHEYLKVEELSKGKKK